MSQTVQKSKPAPVKSSGSTPAKTKKRAAPAEDIEESEENKVKAPKKTKKTKESKDEVKETDDDSKVVKGSTEEDADNADDEDSHPTVADLIDVFVKNRQEQQTFHKSELDLLRNIKKVYKKEIRALAKAKGKRSRKGTKREPSGIATDKYISPQLCEFLALPVGSRLPRTTVTTRMTAYVKENKLLGRDGHLRKDGKLSLQYITPNDALKELIGDPEDLNFFSLQTALNPHFVEPQQN